MALFRTTTQGGSWNGGGTQVPTCSTAQQTRINTALATIQGILNRWDLPCITNVRDRLQDRINCSLRINCSTGNDCSGLLGYTDSLGSPNVTLCNPAGRTLQQLTATLFHEMVHSVDGTELDAEALENHFFTGSGATFPTEPGDFDSFRSDEGNFVIWDSGTGQVFERCVEGGSWDSAPTVTRGRRLNVNFTEPTPPGGGGSWV
jgi:hypothetical protein